jgi:hypothetical protein
MNKAVPTFAVQFRQLAKVVFLFNFCQGEYPTKTQLLAIIESLDKFMNEPINHGTDTTLLATLLTSRLWTIND